MSELKVNAITDASGGNTTQINGATPTTDNTMGRNRIINGAMEIDQRNAGAAVSTDGSFVVDRFKFYESVTSATATGQQSTDAPAGFKNSLVYTVGTGASPGATDYAGIQQRVEGYNIADFGFGTSDAKTFTLSFWVKSSVTGTFGVSFRNGGSTRSYIASYTINSANTWEYKTITIPGDTSGTWLNDNEAGISCFFDLGIGSTYSTTAGSWQAGNFFGLTGGAKLSSTSGATFYITGVQLEAGSVATSFERRSYGQELALCQRYYQLIASEPYKTICNATYYSSSAIFGHLRLLVEMRSVPSIDQTTGTGYFAVYRNGVADAFNSLSVTSATKIAVEVTNQTEVSGTAGFGAFVRTYNANSYLALSAEL